MAHFRKRGMKGKETWTYIIDLGIDPLTKKRRQVSKGGFEKKKDAQAAARLVESEIERGIYTRESSMTFETLAKEWLAYYSHSVKISSVRAREKELKHFCNLWGPYQLRNITKKMYQDRILELNNQYSHNYISGIHACGRMLFRYAFDMGYIKINPTDKIQLPKKQTNIEDLENEEEEVNFFEKEELALFLKLSKDFGLDMDETVFTTLAYTGLRIGEMLALKWNDIDFEVGKVRVTKTLYNPNNNFRNFQLLTPKTRGSIRTLKIAEKLLIMLQEHKTTQNKTKLKNRNLYKDFGFIFARPDGYPQLRKVVETRLKRLLKRTNIEKNITPHSFRHTHTSLLIEAGVGIKEIQKRLGHTDIKTTMNIYAHLTSEMEEKASQKFNNLMEDLLL